MPDFTFEHDGITYALPPVTETTRKAPGWVVQDALMYPENYQAQMRLALYALEESDATDEAREALRQMSGDAMLEVITDWMGESGRSSQSSASTEGQSSTTAEPDSDSPSPKSAKKSRSTSSPA